MGKHLTDRPWLTVLADQGDTIGECAHCREVIKENLSTLDDAYGVWRGVCPHCKAVNLLDQSGKHGIRGYMTGKMWTVLPTDHEMTLNKWDDTEIVRECSCSLCKENKPNNTLKSKEKNHE